METVSEDTVNQVNSTIEKTKILENRVNSIIEKTKILENFEFGQCPKCGSSWDGGSILETFIKQREDGVAHSGKSDEEIRESIEGWSQEKISGFIDGISDDVLDAKFNEFVQQPHNKNWVERNRSPFIMDNAKSLLKRMNVRDLDLFLYDAFKESCAGSYGPPYRFSRVIGIEIQGAYDGVSYWKCPDCGTTWNRWTGIEEEVQEAHARPNHARRSV